MKYENKKETIIICSNSTVRPGSWDVCSDRGVSLLHVLQWSLMRIDSDTISLRKHALVLLRNVFVLNKKKTYDVTLWFFEFLANIVKKDLCCKVHI